MNRTLKFRAWDKVKITDGDVVKVIVGIKVKDEI